jgi:hypothetical protein
MSLSRWVLGLAAALSLVAWSVPVTVQAAPFVSVEWVPSSPFVAFADDIYGVQARPTFRVVNAASQQVRVDATIQMDPPERVVPGDPPMATCGQTSPVAGATAIGTCDVPITARQVTDATVIHVSIAYRAYDEDGALLESGTTPVLDVVGVPSPADLSVTIDPLPPTLLIAPTEVTLAYDVENTGALDLEAVTLMVHLGPSSADHWDRTECRVDIGPLAVGAAHHETCLIALAPADAGRFPLGVTVIARGTAGDLTTTGVGTIVVPLVVAGPHLEIDLTEIGLNDTQPAPGDTFLVEVQVYNVGAEALDVSTSSVPASPDCAREIGMIAAANARIFQCAVLVPLDTAVCVMPYAILAAGTTDSTTVEARIDSVATLTQPDGRCGPVAATLPPTDAASTPRGPDAPPAAGSPVALAIAMGIMAFLAGLAGPRWLRRRSTARR